MIRAAPPLLGLVIALAPGCAETAPSGGSGAAIASASAPSAASATIPASHAAVDGGADGGADAGDGGPARPPRPSPPRVRELEVPEETKSPLPKPDEWKDIVRRDVAIRSEYTCTMQRLREWHRITCDCSNALVALVAGTRDGVSVWATEERAQILFPVRRGDRRVLQVTPHAKIVGGMGPYGGPGEVPGGPPIVISETWLEGDDAPILVVQ